MRKKAKNIHSILIGLILFSIVGMFMGDYNNSLVMVLMAGFLFIFTCIIGITYSNSQSNDNKKEE